MTNSSVITDDNNNIPVGSNVVIVVVVVIIPCCGNVDTTRGDIAVHPIAGCVTINGGGVCAFALRVGTDSNNMEEAIVIPN